ncbi:hypothetical protein F4808DRAFT_218935 [Astrocystis sublimbata]|nr:hypothetical protein F4808DRAFT_218935 [Astrocystis sublimbata]
MTECIGMESREEEPRRRRRPALSCLACRRRKLKCDRATPCARCIEAKVSCTYRVHNSNIAASLVRTRDVNEGSATSDTLGTPPTPIASRGPSRNIPTSPSRGGCAATPIASHVVSENSINQNEITRGILPDRGNLQQQLRPSEEPSDPTRGLVETGRQILTRQAGLRGSKIRLKKTRMLRWSDWMSHAPEFQTIPLYKSFQLVYEDGAGFSSQNAELRALVLEVEDLYKKCKRVARALKANRPSRSLSSTRPDLEPPSREIADRMVDIYFQCFESAHRIFHQPSFRTEYEKLWADSESMPIGQRLKILLVIAIGSSVGDEGGPDSELRGKVQRWIYTAQAWLSGPLEKDRLNIQGLQIHCLAMIARQIFSVGGDLVWMSMGSLIHRAMQIGLHRDPKHLPTMSLLEAEIRRRLWYTILELIVQSSLDSAMPPRISFDDFDTESPANCDDGEIDESTTSLSEHSSGRFTATSIQLLLIKYLPCRLRTIQLLNGLHSELAYPDVLALSAEIMSACQACSKFVAANRQAGITAFQRNMCDFLVRRFLFPLHCPFAIEARSNHLFHYSRTVSLEGGLAFMSPEPDAYFSRLIATGDGMYREGFRCAISAITLELLVQAQSQRDDGTFQTNKRRLEFLKQAVIDIIALSWERIRQGETNIKGPMFLDLVLAMVNAPDLHEMCELEMAKIARDSLVLCHDILDTRAKALSLSSPYDGSMTSSSLDGDQGPFDLDFNFDFFFPNEGYM